MDLSIKGKSALVFGAGADVGRATALRLATEGARVGLVGRNRDTLQSTADEIVALGGLTLPVPADARRGEEILRAVAAVGEAFGEIELVANTIGPFPFPAPGADVAPAYADDASWAEVFETIFMTGVRISREVMPILKAAGRGAVVHLASASVRYYNPRTAQYAAMKAALAHATKNWARDGAPHGVRVNTILPGWIRGARVAGALEDRARAEGRAVSDIEHEMVARPEGPFWAQRMGRPDEYAAVIAFLLSECAAYMNGALVPVDGGTAG